MSSAPSKWLSLGEWLLNRRWWWITLASLSVIFFEFMEYEPFQQGVEISFFFEITFYGIMLPLSTGLALSWLAASRAELAWTMYYQDLIPNLALQLHDTGTYAEGAEVFLQFVKVLIPLTGVSVYKYEQNEQSYKTVLNWSLEAELPSIDSNIACTEAVCPFITVGDATAATPQVCRDPKIVASSRSSRYFCVPFLFSNSMVAGARLRFPYQNQPSPAQVRLLKEISPAMASTFQRIYLERLMKRQGDQINVEQQRIARDVHDTLGHSLAYLRLRLDQINMEFGQTETNTLHKEVESLRDVAKEAYDQMREVLVILSPDTDSNISNTLMNYADKISQRANFKVQIQQFGRPRVLPALIQRNIFYIFQESLTNIEKHAHARCVDIRLEWREDGFEVGVADDGVGYDTALQIPNGHFGLSNMHERALESHARLWLSSQPGQGTLFSLFIPYEEEPS